MMFDPKTRSFVVIAQDPSVRHQGRILRAKASVPRETLEPGPRGARIHVVDYDVSTGTFYAPADLPEGAFENADDKVLMEDPAFHAQNVYAISMRTLARLEFALGRRVPWGFSGHQLQIAPHALAEPNAFYSERDHGLFFGYFPTEGGRAVYTCLSHDVIAHETTHALLDGLRDHYTDPALPDQAAFHEGFADIVALLSVFSLEEVADAVLAPRVKGKEVDRKVLTAEWLRGSALLGLAEEMGAELSGSGPRRDALRRSAKLEPDPAALSRLEYQEGHLRGEILVWAVLNAFAQVWERRLTVFGDSVPTGRISEEGAHAAEQLLNITVRALDYCPPLDLKFGDYLSAMLTADWELVPDDSRYEYRELLRAGFAAWGIMPASTEADDIEPGIWGAPESPLDYAGIHFRALQRDPDEVFRFLWLNREQLKVYEGAFTWVKWVRPAVRVGPDGFVLRETLAEYVQLIDVEARELGLLNLSAPPGMPSDTVVTLSGGGTLVFDEFGRLKYHVRKRIENTEHQQEKIDYLWETMGVDSDNRIGVAGPTSPWEQVAEWHRMRIGSLNRG